MVGIRKDRAVQNMEGVHLRLIPKLGNEKQRAFMEGVHLMESAFMESAFMEG